MASKVDTFADYIRAQGKESNSAVSIQEVMSALDISKQMAYSLRSNAMRRFDDIYPCAPGMTVYEPDWIKNHPEDWLASQERSEKARTKKPDRSLHQKGPEGTRRKIPASVLPNVVGPIITIHNVVAVSVYENRVSVQHTDGTYTDLDGSLTLKSASVGRDDVDWT